MKKDNTQTIKPKIKRQFRGTVVNANANKTINVEVVSIKLHPKYKKQYKSSKKYAVHDENNLAKQGDVVIFEETRPISKTKRWRLVQIVE